MKEPLHNRDLHLAIEQVDGLVDAAGADGAREIVDAFQRSTTELLAALRDRVGAGDLAAVATHAHAVKGSAANVGAKRLAETAARIEQASRAGDAAAVSAAVNDAAEDFDLFTICFHEHLSRR